MTHALARTFVEDADITLLADMAAKSPQAAAVLAEQVAFLGGRPPKKKEHAGSSTEDYARSGTPPDIAKFKANDYGKLVKVLDHRLGYEHQREAVRDWLLRWEGKGQGRQALKSIKDFFEEEDRTLSAETVLDVAYEVSKRAEGTKAAFYWLVKAHIHRNGWQSYWTSDSEIMRRLKNAAEAHRSDWKRFIFETSVRAKYWRRRNYDFAMGTKYLVRFLLMVGQKQLAADFTKSCVKIVREEVSDEPLPECPWFN